MKRVFIAIEQDREAIARMKETPDVEIHVMESPPRGAYRIPEPLAGEIHVLFCEFPPENIGEMRSLEYIQLSSAGYSQLFDLNLTERGIRACNGAASSTPPSPSGRSP